jgi:hypothetical protein
MALKQPLPVSFWGAIYLCLVAIFAPGKFNKLDEEDRASLETRPNATARYRIDYVRRALFYSLALVLASGLVGVVLGNIACRCIGKSDVWVTTLQVVGAGLVLWATLAIPRVGNSDIRKRHPYRARQPVDLPITILPGNNHTRDVRSVDLMQLMRNAGDDHKRTLYGGGARLTNVLTLVPSREAES